MKKITQIDLRNYRILENKIGSLQLDLGELKDDLIQRIGKGAKVEIGERTAILKIIERRSVSWRQVVIRLKGNSYVARVIASTKPKAFSQLEVK